ncbi:MAG: GTPase ObgE [Deltaproteobacteria bacterium]|nr:GTPase ObgE [Deltaproteobacteria bacterium]
MRFVDEITLVVKAGDGGNGAVAFLREKFRPKGGPSGGDGGRGGNVVFEADPGLGTLLDLRYRQRLEARRGGDGQGRDCHGRGAEDLVARVPLGTEVFDEGSGALIGDLVEAGTRLVVAEGGRGGRGNARFATPSNQAPRKAEPGAPGEERKVRLTLKLLADVGLVGLPNVGKSTLVSRLSAARPKIADYPFTTLTPNLGVVGLGPGRSFVMADIPGLLPGASRGVGLGVRFLKHVQRTAVLLHILAPDETMENDLVADFEALSTEIAAFDADLAARPRLVAVNKVDLPGVREGLPSLERFLSEHGLSVFPISAVTGEGLDELKARLGEMLGRR